MSQTVEQGSLDARLAELAETRSDCLYYAVTLTADADGKIIVGTQTEWAGWSGGDRQEELRRARLVYGKFAELWTQVGQPYIAVHTTDEMLLFLLAGGNALVEQKLGEEMFPFLLAPEAVAYDGETGFVSPDLLEQTAFRRAPTPKLRMEVLKRDGRRCRICGRNPDDHLDLVLHVHHIRPWERGGITDPKNLITLCHTCHAGLEPHFDYSLFDYLRCKSDETIERTLKEFCDGVANFRKVGFLLTSRKRRKRGRGLRRSGS